MLAVDEVRSRDGRKESVLVKTLLRTTSVLRRVAVVLLCFAGVAAAQAPQEHVHTMAPLVMPFDVAKTLHVFRMTDNGGIQRVVARDAADSGQIALIRSHLQAEAKRFQHGDYSDPASLHGATMPGLAELKAGAMRIKVTYANLRDGGQLVFATRDGHLVTEIHRWFGAQLSEHGADAKAE